jgi:hypothetical protein
MTADDTREALERLADAISGERRDWHEVTVRPDDIAAALAAARRDPEPVASPDAAWMHGSPSVEARIADIEAHEAAIRGTEAGLDVERLARALNSFGWDGLARGRVTPEEAAAATARAYAADSEPS